MSATEVMRYGPSQLGPSFPTMGSLQCLEPSEVPNHRALMALASHWHHNLA